MDNNKFNHRKTRVKRESFWYRSKHDYKTSKHLQVDKLAAKKKLKLLTSTDLYLKNTLEPYRVSSFNLFKLNLTKLSLWLTTSVIYLMSRSISDSILSFTILFTTLTLLLNYHLESYRSFVLIRENVKYLSNSKLNRLKLLNNYLGFNPRISSKDSFNWMNRIIRFFWPYLSHLIHFELNEFFRKEIESGSLANSVESSKRLLYALLRQLDTNILVVERFKLGNKPPTIKKISTSRNTFSKQITTEQDYIIKKKSLNVSLKKVSPDDDDDDNNNNNNRLKEVNKTLAFDLDLDYNGDMYLSVIYRYLCCCSSRLGLADVFLRFKLRIILSPIENDVPFFERISITLLELPDFGYKGIALAELAELRIVRGVMNRLISENLLYPKCLTVSVGKLLQKLINNPESFEKQLSSSIGSKEKQTQLPTTNSSNSKRDVSFMTKILARGLLCGCLITNAFFRCCQKQEQKNVKSTKQE